MPTLLFLYLVAIYFKLIHHALRIPWKEPKRTHLDQTNSHVELKLISYEEALKRASMIPLQARLDIRILQYIGHVSRMGPERMPNRVFFGAFLTRIRTRKLEPFEYNVRQAAQRAGLIPQIWKYQAQDRVKWRSTLEKYKQEETKQRKRRKKRET